MATPSHFKRLIEVIASTAQGSVQSYGPLLRSAGLSCETSSSLHAVVPDLPEPEVPEPHKHLRSQYTAGNRGRIGAALVAIDHLTSTGPCSSHPPDIDRHLPAFAVRRHAGVPL